MVEEVASASPKIELQVLDFFGEPACVRDMAVERIPALLIGNEDAPRLRFYGAPLGCQMATIVETIRSLSRGVSPLRNDTRRQLRSLDRQVQLQIIVSPEDQHSSELAFTAFAMARENPCIVAEAVQIRDFPELARRLAIRSAPTLLVNGRQRAVGPLTEQQLLEHIAHAVSPPSA